MMNKIPCEIIRDLFPSYIDGLTSETTNTYVTDHVAGCPDCKNILDSMQSPGTEPQAETADGEKEIDFLKKNRRRNKRLLLGCILAVVLILAALFVTRYMIGENKSDLNGDFFLWDVQVEENQLSLEGSTVNDIFKIIGFACEETEDGVLDINTRVVPSGMVARILYGKSFHFDFTSSKPIRQVIVNDRIVYNENERITSKASAIYFTRHLYVGDMPANLQTANVVNIFNYLGPFENELQTAEAPYGWTLKLFNDISKERQEIKENDMQSFAYVLLAMIDNLDVVTFDYTVAGKAASKSFTSEEATEFFGQDIKNCYKDVSLLEELLRKTGLDCYIFGRVFSDVYANPYYQEETAPEGSEESTSLEQETTAAAKRSSVPLYFYLVPETKEPIKSICMNICADGVLTTSHGAEHADGSPYERGELIGFSLEQEDFGGKYQKDAVIMLQFDIETEDGTIIRVPQQLRVPNVWGGMWDIHLSGSREEGFGVSQ